MERGKRNVLALGITSFLMDVSHEMALSVIPFFIVDVLGASKAALGAVEGLAELSASTFKLIGGYISDRIGKRKPLATLGYAIAAFFIPLLALAKSWVHAAIIRFLDRIGKGVRTPPRDALIAESVGEETRGFAFGLHRAMDTAGAVIGPLAAIVLLTSFSIREIFLFAAVPAWLSVLVIWLFVEEYSSESEEKGGRRRETNGGVKLDLSSLGEKKLLLFVLAVSLISLASLKPHFLMVRAEDSGFSRSIIILLFTISNVLYAILATPIGILADRFGKRRTLLLGSLLAPITAILASLHSSSMVVLSFLTFGAFMAVYESLSRAILPELVPEGILGSAYGVMHSSIGFSAMAGGVIFGALYDRFGYSIAFYYSALVSVAAIVLLAVLVYQRSEGV